MTDTPERPDPAAGDPIRPVPPPEDPTIRMPPVGPPPNAAPGAEPPPPPGAGVPGEPPPGGVPPPLVPTPGGPTPPEPPNWPMRILIALLAALVVLVAVIAAVLLVGGDDEEPVAATTVPPTVAPTTLAPTTTAATTTTLAETTTTTVAETTTTAAPTTTTEATTTTSTTTTLAATTTAASECAGLEDLQGPIDNFVFLDVDGIGTLTEFGDRDEDVITTLTCLLGEPDEDSGYVDSFSVFGTCPGTEVRGVRWGPLQTIFGDGMLFGSEDREFYNWRYGGAGVDDDLGLTFPDTGLGIDTTVAELQAEYGGDVEIFEDERTGGGAFLIGERQVGEVDFPEIFGLLTDTAPEGTVEFIESGYFCGE